MDVIIFCHKGSSCLKKNGKKLRSNSYMIFKLQRCMHMYYIHTFKIHARVNLLKPSQTFVLDSFPSNKNKNKKHKLKILTKNFY